MTNKVRAKFKVTSTTQVEHWDKKQGKMHTIKLLPVMGTTEENKAFFAATPGGSIDLQVLNEAAGTSFLLGEEYYVDFTPVRALVKDEAVA